MSEPTTTEKPATSPPTNNEPPSILRCIIGSVIAAVMAIGSYFINSSIAQYFALRPIHSPNYIVVNISIAVRTLIIGMSALATGVFGLIAVGLFALGIQVTIQQLKQQTTLPK